MLRLAALCAVIVLVAGCGQAPVSASPSSSATIDVMTPAAATATPTPPATETPTAIPADATTPPRPTATPRPAKAHWEKAGSMRWARHAPIAVLLVDGRVLVVGDEGGKYEAAPANSRHAELWDPATNRWTRTESLPKARGAAAAVTLRDGRALIIGGLNDDYASYSSAYLYDPATEHWTKTGLLDTARTSPAAAVLHDGRVLVAGGTYWGGFRTGADAGADAVLADYRLADLGPNADSRELATAELFDPRTNTWSKTGPMRYARWSASAVTLGDGRVLVSGGGGDRSELYDPDTGRFSLAPSLPSIDLNALERIGVPPQSRRSGSYWDGSGSLLPLTDGDALATGVEASQSGSDGDVGGVAQWFRFNAGDDQWVTIGDPYAVWDDGEGVTNAEWGVKHPCLIGATLRGGQVLCAGGGWSVGRAELDPRRAELLDPTTGSWSALPAMPSPRMAAAAVALADGGALIIGGYADGGDGYPVGLKDVFWFVPGD